MENGLLDENGIALVEGSGFRGDPDADGYSNGEEYLKMGSHPLVPGGFPGYWDWDAWPSLKGVEIHQLTGSSQFLQGPEDSAFVSISEGIVSYGDGYGSRMRGTLTPPETGNYRFYLAADDAGELWVSENEQKFRKHKVAEVSTSTGADTGGTKGLRRWKAYPAQESRWLYLEAGKEYFVEVLHIDHHASDHVSVGVQKQGSTLIEMMESEWLHSNIPDANDVDDDYLPDDRETHYGLDPADNGLTDPRQGERSDFDGDGLTNHEEFMLGTDPTARDSDGDEVEDGDERRLGTDATVSDAIAGEVISTQSGIEFSRVTGDWFAAGDNGEVRADRRRGLIEYTFSVPEAGIWEYRVIGRARGSVQPIERLPLRISINGADIAMKTLVSSSGGPGTVFGLTSWLQAGDHTLGIFHDNVIARRQLQVDSIQISAPSGVDADGNGEIDRVTEQLARNSGEIPATSQVSPLFIEGTTRLEGQVELLLKEEPAQLFEWGGQNWFANLPLSASSPIDANVTFEGGAKSTSQQVTWTKTNVLEGGELTLRKGDKLRLSAWPVDGSINSRSRC